MVKEVESGKYKIRVSVFNPQKKYPVSKESTFYGCYSDALIEERELKSRLKQSFESGLFDIKTFSDAIGLYRENLNKKGGVSIHHNRKIDYLLKNIGKIKISNFAEKYETWLNKNQFSGISRNRYTEIVRACFNYLKLRKIIKENPIDLYRFPKYKEKPRDRYLNKDEQLRLLNAIREHRPYIEPIVQYMLQVPCRISELTEARRDQYNSFNGTIFIPDSKTGIKIYKPVLNMKDYFDSIPPGCPWLFYWIDDKGNFRKFNNIRKPFQYCVKKAGLTDLRIHDLRHISATDMYSQGIPEREIMDIAGWKTLMLSWYRHKDSLLVSQKLNNFYK